MDQGITKTEELKSGREKQNICLVWQIVVCNISWHTKGPLVITGHDLNVTVHFYIIADKVHEHDSSREMTVGRKAPYIYKPNGAERGE